MKKIILITFIFLTGCSNSEYSDIKDWMKQKEQTEKRSIAPLPAAKSFIPVLFLAQNNPFKEATVVTSSQNFSQYAPNPDRRKEPLESYALSQLKMKGFLLKDKIPYGMILAPDGTVNYVTKNNYMGTNYGQILSIDEAEIVLEERIRNGDDWELKKTTILLDEAL